jgi:hypothetical protein
MRAGMKGRLDDARRFASLGIVLCVLAFLVSSCRGSRSSST